MNVKEYIESGVLTSFVLGELNSAQSMEVMNLAKQFPEIKQEIGDLEKSLENAAFEAAIEPPAFARENILATFKENTPGVSTSKQAEILKISYKKSYRSIAAAAAILLIGSLFANGYLFNKLDHKEKLIASLLSDKGALANTVKKQEVTLSALQSPGVKLVQMAGTKNQPSAAANVFWNSKTGEILIDAYALNSSDLEKGYQYQLWAIVDGKPVNAGLFDGDHKKGKMKVLVLTNGGKMPSAFAVTIEKIGGVESPTMEKMILLGASS